MARSNLIRRTVLDLIEDLDHLDHRAMRAPELHPDAAQKIQIGARDARMGLVQVIQEIGRNPERFDTDVLLDSVHHVRRRLDHNVTIMTSHPDEVVNYVQNVNNWTLLLPGDPTTPPP